MSRVCRGSPGVWGVQKLRVPNRLTDAMTDAVAWGARRVGRYYFLGVLANDTQVDSHTAYRFPRRILLHVRNNNAACFELVAAAGGRIQHKQLNSTRLLLGMPMLPNGSTRLPNGHIGLDKD